MPRQGTPYRVTRLWDLSWNGDRLSCTVYRGGKGLEMRLETGATTILVEPFELRPKALARMDTLKRSLKRRGWQERPAD
jgi:hypothetical protein